MFANRISSSTSCSIWLPETSPPSSSRGVLRHRFQSCNTSQDLIEVGVAREMPIVTKYKHDYYGPNGSLQRVAIADFVAGQGSCIRYEKAGPQAVTAKFQFPPDTYSGSTVVIPRAHYLRTNNQKELSLHNFNCVPGPTLLRVMAYRDTSRSWSLYSGELVEMRLKPDFGWLNFFIAPFIPKMDGWFDPNHDWTFVGGKSGRYYRGPDIILVRNRSHDSVNR